MKYELGGKIMPNLQRLDHKLILTYCLDGNSEKKDNRTKKNV